MADAELIDTVEICPSMFCETVKPFEKAEYTEPKNKLSI